MNKLNQVLDNDRYNEQTYFLENRTWQSSLDTDYVFVHPFLMTYGLEINLAHKKTTRKKAVLFL